MNDCGTEERKPVLERECEEEIIEEITPKVEITAKERRSNLYLYLITAVIVFLIILIEEVTRRRKLSRIKRENKKIFN